MDRPNDLHTSLRVEVVHTEVLRGFVRWQQSNFRTRIGVILNTHNKANKRPPAFILRYGEYELVAPRVSLPSPLGAVEWT